MAETEDYDKTATPTAHKTTHQDGGSDEISVAALSGELADEQPSSWAKVSGKPATFTPTAHKTSHQDGGSDEVSVLGLSGLLGDAQTPLTHKASHQDGGSDEISAGGLSGLLADDQHVLDTEVTDLISISDKTGLVNYNEIVDLGPLAHNTTHQDGGADEISVAGLSGLLADDQHVLDSEVLAATNYLFQDCVLYTEIVTYP
jgi:hypothetical protein